MQRINKQGNLNTRSIQANQQVQTSSIEQNRTNPQSAAVPTNIPSATARPPLPPTAADISTIESKSDDQAQTDSDNIAAKDKDTALRAQLIPVGAPPITHSTSAAGEEGATADAGGVEESKGFDILPQDVVVEGVLPFLDPDSLGNFAQRSETSKNDAIESANSQLPSLREELKQLITTSGITGIQNPEGPFKNSIHELSVLTDFKNAIIVLQDKGITNINKREEYGVTPLQLRAFMGHTDVVNALITAGADVNARGEDEETPLHKAAFMGNEKTLEALITAGAEVNAKNNDGNTPLKVAARRGRTWIVKILKAANKIFKCCKSGNLDSLSKLLIQYNFVNFKVNGKTPLHRAVKYGHDHIVTQLNKSGADVSATDKHGRTPLHVAAINGHKEIAQALLDAGAVVNLADNDGRTPLHEATCFGHTEILEALLDAGANVDLVDYLGRTPLRLLEELNNSKPSLIKKFKTMVRNIRKKQPDKYAPLEENPRETIRELLNKASRLQKLKQIAGIDAAGGAAAAAGGVEESKGD